MLGMAVNWGEYQPARGAKPMYAQLADFISEAIRKGDFQAGDQIPAERRLAELTGHSVDLVRQAMGVLRDRGLVETGHGTGTFVKGS
jgi:DNA-binding GntR family transcriptional regulator